MFRFIFSIFLWFSVSAIGFADGNMQQNPAGNDLMAAVEKAPMGFGIVDIPIVGPIINEFRVFGCQWAGAIPGVRTVVGEALLWLGIGCPTSSSYGVAEVS